MFVNDDIYYFLSDMTENEKQKEGDYLMTCFVIHVSLLSLHIFFRHSCFTKKLVVYHPLTNLSLTSVGFLLIIETLIIILATKRSVVLNGCYEKRRYTENLLLKYVVRRVILYLLARVFGKERVSRSSRVYVYYLKKPKPLASIVPSICEE